jgi:hypothetical protein
MLFCLFGLPLAALRGTSWHQLAKTVPEIAIGVIAGNFGEGLVLARESPPKLPQRRTLDNPSIGPTATPRYRSEPLDQTVGEAAQGVATLPTDRQTSFQDRCLSPAAMKPFAVPSSVLDGIEASSAASAPPRSETNSRDHPPLVSMAWHDRGQGATDTPPLQDAMMRPGANALDASASFQQVLDRLRDLGAVHYMLETWGNNAQRFRFHCEMALSNNPNYLRHFEAIDRDALQAMTQVLAEVEAWRREH